MRHMRSRYTRIRKPLWGAILLVAFFVPMDAFCQTEYVRPVDWQNYADKLGARPGDSLGQTLASILQQEARYELKWVHADHQIVRDLPGWQGVECYYPKFHAYGYEQAVRPLGSFAYSMAGILKTGIYSPELAGLSTAEAIRRVELAVRGAALTNVANAPAGERWGQGLPAAQIVGGGLLGSPYGRSGLVVMGRTEPAHAVAVAKMVEHDADAFLDRLVPYWTNKNGKVRSPGDTKAEENAWNSHLLAVAQVMMPHHPHAAVAAEGLGVPGWCVQSAERSAEHDVVNGKPVRDWLDGYNVFPDGVLVNHNRVHPDYIVSDLPRSASMVGSLPGPPAAPRSLVFNVEFAYLRTDGGKLHAWGFALRHRSYSCAGRHHVSTDLRRGYLATSTIRKGPTGRPR